MMEKSTINPLLIAIGFLCLAFLLWLIPTQAQDDSSVGSDEEQAAAAMDSLAEKGTGIVNINSDDASDSIDVESTTSLIQPRARAGIENGIDKSIEQGIDKGVDKGVDTGSMMSQSTVAQASQTPGAGSSQQSSNANESVRVLLVPKREVALTSLTADSVTEIKVVEGDRVEKGQLLVKLSCNEPRASMKVAKSRLAQYKMIHEANQELFQEEAITELDLELSGVKVDEGNGEVALASARMQRCMIKAPYDGTAAVVNVTDFANVQIGEPLLTIIDSSSYELILNVPSLWLRSRQALVNKVFEVSVDETGKSYQAVVARIGSVIDPSSRTVQLTAVIPGDNPELAPGMSGNAVLTAEDP